MNQAIVVGGSNGIGLSITQNLIFRGYHVNIIDRVIPDTALEEYAENITYYKCDLLNFDKELFEKLALDAEVKCLMITAGFGRVTNFENLSIEEIDNLFTVNTVAGVKIIKCFYDRIRSKEPFYTGMMVSIAGYVSSPMFTVYAASKAALMRFIESVNIELEVNGSHNRILNVSPGSIIGTKFNGAEINHVDLTADLANQIVDHMLNCEEKFIPEYEKTYKSVIERYESDPHAFGLSSYQYS